MSAILSTYVVAEANKTLAALLDEVDSIKEVALSLNLEEVREASGEASFMAFSQALQSAKMNLATVTLTLVVAKAMMAGEKPGDD